MGLLVGAMSLRLNAAMDFAWKSEQMELVQVAKMTLTVMEPQEEMDGFAVNPVEHVNLREQDVNVEEMLLKPVQMDRNAVMDSVKTRMLTVQAVMRRVDHVLMTKHAVPNSKEKMQKLVTVPLHASYLPFLLDVRLIQIVLMKRLTYIAATMIAKLRPAHVPLMV